MTSLHYLEQLAFSTLTFKTTILAYLLLETDTQTTNLNAGIYFVELKDQDGKRIMKKVIKQ